MYRQQAETEGSGPALTDKVHELLARLTAEERQILLLRALEHYNFEQIAVIVGMNPARVRKKYERLRDKLGRQKRRGRSDLVNRAVTEDEQLGQLEQMIRETPVKIDLTGSVMERYEQKRRQVSRGRHLGGGYGARQL